MLSINLLSDFRGYKQDEESVVLCIHGFPTSNYDWSKVGGPLCLYEPVNAKLPLPPIFDWGLFLYSREFDPKWSPPSQALTFISKCWSALQAKGFCNFFCILHEEMRSKVIAPIFTDLLEHLRAFESLWKSPLNVGFVEWTILKEDITISSWLWVNSPWALWSIYYIIKRLNSSVTHFKVLSWRQHIRAQERYMKWF